ncbi:MAG: hypothetical protein HRT45_04590 [Bdellovibrionales bacterium]|nr:hypothetical protein [Bdellovibrionales bacterium]
MTHSLKTAFFLLFVLSAVGCGDSNHSKITPSNDGFDSPVSGKVDFQNIQSQVLEKYDCTRCHSSYRSFSVASANAEKILERMSRQPGEVGFMPQGGSKRASRGDLAILQKWINDGTPEINEPDEPGDGEDDPVEPITTPISFEMVSNEVLEKRCNTCHTQFRTYRYVKNNADRILSFVKSGQMPLSPRNNQIAEMKDVEKALLEVWVNAGAPEFADTPAEDVEPLPLEPTWISLQENIFGPRCVMCHSQNNRRGPIDISTYEAFEEQAEDLFDMADPFNSPFIGAIIAREEQDFLDPMPAEWARIPLEPVSQEELLVIEEWIRRGRPSGL